MKTALVKQLFAYTSTVVLLTMVSACSSVSLNRAPVVNVMPSASGGKIISNSASLPGSENAGKLGYYTVRPGDTVIRIALEYGQSPKDLTAWNKLTNPNSIEVGQVLRVTPPTAAHSAGTATTARSTSANSANVEVKPISNPRNAVVSSSLTNLNPTSATNVPATTSGASKASTLDSSSPTTPAATAGAATSGKPAPTPAASDANAQPTTQEDLKPGKDVSVKWTWPTANPIAQGFDNDKNKGLNFSGNVGDPVYAAADGIVVYVGNGLRGYGNLIILKHNDQFITAYAHNQNLMVKEDQVVKRGQQIATMGSSDASTPTLHFEVRKDGQPVDPSKFLPKR